MEERTAGGLRTGSSEFRLFSGSPPPSPVRRRPPPPPPLLLRQQTSRWESSQRGKSQPECQLAAPWQRRSPPPGAGVRGEAPWQRVFRLCDTEAEGICRGLRLLGRGRRLWPGHFEDLPGSSLEAHVHARAHTDAEIRGVGGGSGQPGHFLSSGSREGS